MSEKNRYLLMCVVVAVQGLIMALIAFAGMDELVGFAGGFGAVMILLGLIEGTRKIRAD